MEREQAIDPLHLQETSLADQSSPFVTAKRRAAKKRQLTSNNEKQLTIEDSYPSNKRSKIANHLVDFSDNEDISDSDMDDEHLDDYKNMEFKSKRGKKEQTTKQKTTIKKCLAARNTVSLSFSLSKLKELGYISKHIKQLKKFPKKFSEKVLKLITIDAELKPYFTCDDLIKIIQPATGLKNIEAVINTFQTLIQLGFDKNDIVKIAGKRTSGSLTIKTIFNKAAALKNLGLSIKNIVQIANHEGASQNIEAVLEHFSTIKSLGFTLEQLLRIVNHDGGIQNVNALLEHFQALNTLGFTHEQLVRIVNHQGGSQNIKVLHENYENLIELGLTQEEIFKIASERTSYYKIKKLVKTQKISTSEQDVLPEVRFTNFVQNTREMENPTENLRSSMVIDIFSNDLTIPSEPKEQSKVSSTQTTFDKTELESETVEETDLIKTSYNPSFFTTTVNQKIKVGVVENAYTYNSDDEYNHVLPRRSFNQNRLRSQLTKLGYTKAHVAQLKNDPEKLYEKISKLIEIEPLLKQYFTCDELIKIIKPRDGLKNITAVVENYQILINMQFSSSDIVKIASHYGSSQNISTTIEHFEQIKNLHFTTKEFVQIVGHQNGWKNIRAILENYENLTAVNFTNKQILKIIGNGGGYNKIKILLENYDSLKILCNDNDGIIKFIRDNRSKRNIENALMIKDLDLVPQQSLQPIQYEKEFNTVTSDTEANLIVENDVFLETETMPNTLLSSLETVYVPDFFKAVSCEEAEESSLEMELSHRPH